MDFDTVEILVQKGDRRWEEINFGEKQKKLLAGVDKLAIVKITLGPKVEMFY